MKCYWWGSFSRSYLSCGLWKICFEFLTQFRMGFFGAAFGWHSAGGRWREGLIPLPKTCYTYFFNSSYLIWDILLYEYAMKLCNFVILIMNSNLWEIQTLIIEFEAASNITFYLLETIFTLCIFQKLFLLNCFETKKSISSMIFLLFAIPIISENLISFHRSKNVLLGSSKFKIYSYVGLHYKKNGV